MPDVDLVECIHLMWKHEAESQFDPDRSPWLVHQAHQQLHPTVVGSQS